MFLFPSYRCWPARRHKPFPSGLSAIRVQTTPMGASHWLSPAPEEHHESPQKQAQVKSRCIGIACRIHHSRRCHRAASSANSFEMPLPWGVIRLHLIDIKIKHDFRIILSVRLTWCKNISLPSCLSLLVINQCWYLLCFLFVPHSSSVSFVGPIKTEVTSPPTGIVF